jgi:PAS domain S-box-containing protein
MQDAVVGTNSEFQITAWNAGAELLYGWKAEEVLGRSIIEVLQTEWPGADPEVMRHKIDELGRWRGEASQLRRDGTRIPVEMSTVVLRDENGAVSGLLSVNHDITQRRHAAEALQARLEELQRWHAVTLEREERILDLKRQVNELLIQADQPVRYASVNGGEKQES